MKKVVIYGCGNNFLNSFKFLNSEYEIVALIDGSPEKRGMQIGGYIIQGIDAIKALVYDKIIVTPNVYLEITEVLLNNGICENNIWYLHELKPVNITGNVLNVCFFVMGEIEDKIINLNYIYHFYTRYQNANMKIDLMCDHDTELIKAFVDANSIFKSICTYKEEALNKQYDLFIKILRYPEVVKANKDRIAKLAPELIDYLLLYEKFRVFNPRCYSETIVNSQGYLLEEIKGRTRIMQPDFYGYLGVEEAYAYPLDVDTTLLDKYEIGDNAFVTIHKGEGVEASRYSVRLWSDEYYTELIQLLKKRWPNIKIIMVGIGCEKTTGIQGYDMDLAGTTDMHELKAILKSSCIHIDIDGSLVHLRHALKGGVSVYIDQE